MRVLLANLIVCFVSWSALTHPAQAADYAGIPAGTFESVLSSASGTTIAVNVPAFALRVEPVTVLEFADFIKAHPEWSKDAVPSIFADGSYLKDDPLKAGSLSASVRPITNVSWFAATAFCESEGARLPRWYEWEFVAAADKLRADARKDPQWRASILNWYSQSSKQSRSTIGGALNFYGVRDMHGLVWEWVEDFNALLVSADSRDQGDPEKLQYCGAGAISLQDRENFAILMRVALLSSLSGADTTSNLGFRCAKDLPKDAQ